MKNNRLIALAVMAAFTGAAHAGFETFTPLTASSPALPVGSPQEAKPLTLSSTNFSQRTVDANASTGSPNRRGDNWDMITANQSGASAGRYLFSPYETSSAGVKRFDRQTGTSLQIVAPGTQGFVSGDASRWTPYGTYLTAEESWGSGSSKGRLFEITNPVTTTGAATTNFVQRNVIPRVSHEGLAFDKAGNLYFVDELNGGSIYKYTSKTPNADTFFDAGQTFVLKVGGGNNFGATGIATWVPITDANGNALNGANNMVIGGVTSVDGRKAADSVFATGYNRPEDLEIGMLGNGKQALYFTATDTHNVFSIQLTDENTAAVNLFVDRNTIDKATGLAVGSAFTNPDNLAIDANGNIYIVEDQPGGVADVWFAFDANRDGIAESIGRWLSMNTTGAEPTGLYFDPFNPNLAYLNIQHADSDIDRMIQISAVPEPETLPLALAGLGLLGVIGRRRKQNI
ncbi:MAG: alkaline phosphatase PhoX [Betaproteobacteria bacterium]